MTVRVTSYTVAAAGTAARAPALVAGRRRDRAHSTASRVTTSASAIRNSAATHASTLVIKWLTENRSIAGAAPWLVAHAKPIRAPIPTTHKIAAAQTYQKAYFRTVDIYGPTPDPELRLITCGGTFDYAT